MFSGRKWELSTASRFRLFKNRSVQQTQCAGNMDLISMIANPDAEQNNPFHIDFSCTKTGRSLKRKRSVLHVLAVILHLQSVSLHTFNCKSNNWARQLPAQFSHLLVSSLFQSTMHKLNKWQMVLTYEAKLQEHGKSKVYRSNALRCLPPSRKGIQLITIWAPACTEKLRRTDYAEVSIYLKDKIIVKCRWESVERLKSSRPETDGLEVYEWYRGVLGPRWGLVFFCWAFENKVAILQKILRNKHIIIALATSSTSKQIGHWRM